MEPALRARLRAAVVKSCRVWLPALPLPQEASSILCQLLPFRSRSDAQGHKMSVWRLVFESFGSQIVVTSFRSKAAPPPPLPQNTKPRGGGGCLIGQLITALPGCHSLHQRRDGEKTHPNYFSFIHLFSLSFILSYHK